MKHKDPLVITNFTQMRNKLKKKASQSLLVLDEQIYKGYVNTYVTRAWDVLARKQELVPGKISTQLSIDAEIIIIPLIKQEFEDFLTSLRIFLED